MGVEYQVEVAVGIGPAASDPDVGDRLLAVLEEYPGVLGPVVRQDTSAQRVAVMMGLDTAEAWSAAQRAWEALVDSLARLELSGALLELHVTVTSTSDEIVTGAEIARRLGVSRERVRQWASREQYAFPAAVRRLGSAKVWRWADVARWDAEHRQVTPRTD